MVTIQIKPACSEQSISGEAEAIQSLDHELTQTTLRQRVRVNKVDHLVQPLHPADAEYLKRSRVGDSSLVASAIVPPHRKPNADFLAKQGLEPDRNPGGSSAEPNYNVAPKAAYKDEAPRFRRALRR